MTNLIRSRTPVLAALFVLSAFGVARAATIDVEVGGAGPIFTPDDITININDTVRWTWAGGFHNVRSGVAEPGDGNFDSGDSTTTFGTIFEVTFDNAFLAANPMPGDAYPYYCEPHLGIGMTGTVTVTMCDEDCALPKNGQIDVTDLLDVLGQWGSPGSCDIDGLNNVDVTDLLAVLAKWGSCA